MLSLAKKYLAVIALAVAASISLAAPSLAAISPNTVYTVTARYYYSSGDDFSVGDFTLRYQPNNTTESGYDFTRLAAVGPRDGAMYICPTAAGALRLCANNPGQGGVARLKNLSALIPSVKTKNAYQRAGLALEKNAVYAIYDQKHDLYVKIRISDIAKRVIGTPASVSSLAQPAITAPFTDTIFTNNPRTVNLIWNPVQGAEQYEVIVDCDGCTAAAGWRLFKTYPRTIDTRLLLSFTEDHSYRVRVRAIGGGVRTVVGPYSDEVLFSFDTSAPAVIGQPVIRAPEEKDVVSVYPRTVQVRFDRVNEAKSYEVQIDCNFCTGADGWAQFGTYHIDAGKNPVISWTTQILPSDTEYRIRVRAKNAQGQGGPWSKDVNFRFTTVTLPAPVIVEPTRGQLFPANSRHTFRATWKPVEKAVKYALEVSCADCSEQAASTQLYLTSSTSTAYEGITVPADGQYRIRIQSVDQYNNRSPWSDYTYAKFQGAGGFSLPTPGLLSPTPNLPIKSSETFLNVSWSKVAAATSYVIRISCDSCDSNHVWNHEYDTQFNVTTYPVPLFDLPLGDNTFSLAVKAINSGQVSESNWSSPVIFSYSLLGAEIDAPVVSSPVNGVELTNYPRTVLISWNPVQDGVSYGGEIEQCSRCGSANDWRLAQSFTTPNYVTGMNVTLSEDKNYRVRVRAFDANKNPSEWSKEYIYFRFNAALPKPTITSPSNRSTVTNQAGYMNLSWTNVAGANHYVVEYEFDYCCNTNSTRQWSGDSRKFVITDNNDTTLRDLKLTALSHQYRFRVQAVNNLGSRGAWSDYRYVSFVPNNQALTAPVVTAPKTNQVLAAGTRTVLVSWLPLTGVDHYEVMTHCDQCVTTEGAVWNEYPVFPTLNAATSLQIKVPESKGYWVWVRGVTDSGVGGLWSSAIHFSVKP